MRFKALNMPLYISYPTRQKIQPMAHARLNKRAHNHCKQVNN